MFSLRLFCFWLLRQLLLSNCSHTPYRCIDCHPKKEPILHPILHWPITYTSQSPPTPKHQQLAYRRSWITQTLHGSLCSPLTLFSSPSQSLSASITILTQTYLSGFRTRTLTALCPYPTTLYHFRLVFFRHPITPARLCPLRQWEKQGEYWAVRSLI